MSIVEITANEKIKIAFFGDLGTNTVEQLLVRDLLINLHQKENLTAVVILGDIFNQNGVKDSNDLLWNYGYFDIYNIQQLQTLPFFICLGNHDYKGNKKAYITQNKINNKWNFPDYNYIIKFGDILSIFSINSNFPFYSGLNITKIDKLSNQMTKIKTTHKIMAGHHPFISGGKYKKIRSHLSFFYKKIYKAADVNLYLTGHEHNFQYITVNEHDKIYHEMCCGTGGSGLYQADYLTNQTKKIIVQHGLLLGEFTKNTVKYNFISHDNKQEILV